MGNIFSAFTGSGGDDSGPVYGTVQVTVQICRRCHEEVEVGSYHDCKPPCAIL